MAGARSRQQPIRDYGLLGDTRGSALSSKWGSIDWMAVPHFHSPPLFSSLLGTPYAFSIGVDGITRTSRRYLPGTPVLENTWDVDGARVRLTEGMITDLGGWLSPGAVLVRHLEAEGEPVEVRVEYSPGHGFLRTRPRVERRHGALLCSWGALAVTLTTAPDLELRPFTEQVVRLHPDRPITFVVAIADREPAVLTSPQEMLRRLHRDARGWQEWSGSLAYEGSHREAVERSLITLRMSTYSPSGAPVAAPTTSLPEHIGGSRNWDYRYSWIRDASIGLSAFLEADKPEEAHSYMHWLLHASRLTRPKLRVLYTTHGTPPQPEEEIPELAGYRDSRPVRVGNAAADQHQLDIYGWIIDAGWRLSGHRRLHSETRRALAGFGDHICDHWREPDAGIWEVRGEPRHFTHSKLMAWAGLDRLIQMAGAHQVRDRRLARWRKARTELRDVILEQGYDDRRRSFVQALGESAVDASLLLVPVMGLESGESPRVHGTIDAIIDELGGGGPFLHRYAPGSDGLDGEEGAFFPCSFWLVQALAAAHRVDEAAEVFDVLCGASNDLGLYPEELDRSSQEFLGNFPLAFTHATHAVAAMALTSATRR
jgi:GH15 family glucan-1,4-alpha-glucosidase